MIKALARRKAQADGNFAVPRPSVELPFTGERMTTAMEGQIEFEHFHRYCLARDYCAGLDVLDVASGEGYGSALLAGVAHSVVGVEIDSGSVAHARAAYAAPNLHFLAGDAQAIPLANASVDVVVSFETLEHVPDQARFLLEVRRVLRAGGLFIVSTPDRTVYSAPGSDPNPYHVHELTVPELTALMSAHFQHHTVLHQRPVLGSIVAGEVAANWRSYERRSLDRIEATNGLARAHYLVALGSDAELPDVGPSMYADRRRVHDVVEGALSVPELRLSLSAALAARAELEFSVAGHRGELAATRAELEDAASQRDELRRALQSAETRLVQTEQTLQGVWASTSWRILGPFRRLGRRFPTLARRLRQAIKVVWWTLTLQIGHRFMLWRRHRMALGQAGVATVTVPPAVTIAAPTEIPPTEIPPASGGGPDVGADAGPDVGPDVGAQTNDLCSAFEALHGSTEIYFPPVAAPEVSIIVPAYQHLDDLLTCLRSIAASRATEPTFEVIVVDDCPEWPVLWALPRCGGLVGIANEENLGFLRSCNRAAEKARGRVLCFLNSDTIVLPGWLAAMVQALDETPRAALAGSMLLNRDGTIQDAGWRIMRNGWGHSLGRGADARDGAHTHRRLVDCVTGACFCVPRTVWNELGGFDPAYAPAFYEEFDLAFRAKQKGLKVVYEPRSRVIHLGSASYGAEQRDRLSSINHGKFVQRFAEMLPKQPEDVSDEYALRHAGPERPTILVIDYAVPVPEQHAGDVTMASYLRLLVDGGWRVVFGPANGIAGGPPCDALEAIGVEMIRAPQTITGWLAAHGRHVRHVWIGRPELAGDLIDKVRAATAAPIAYYTHDLHHLRMRREADLRNDAQLASAAEEMRHLELHVLRAVDHVMTPSSEEGELIRDLAPEARVTNLPGYYYDDHQIRARSAAEFGGVSDVLFVGGFPHTPNVDAALHIVRDIMPLVWRVRPEARLLLVGYAPPPEVEALANDRVVVTGQVPDLTPFMEGSRLMLAALRYGAGVKGKVVEAMRWGLPVVTTPIGAEGIGIKPDDDAIVVEDAAGLAAGVLHLLNDADYCARLSEAGAALIRRRFSRAAARSALDGVFGPGSETVRIDDAENLSAPPEPEPPGDEMAGSSPRADANPLIGAAR